jgi:hypothetical protein
LTLNVRSKDMERDYFMTPDVKGRRKVRQFRAWKSAPPDLFDEGGAAQAESRSDGA